MAGPLNPRHGDVPVPRDLGGRLLTSRGFQGLRILVPTRKRHVLPVSDLHSDRALAFRTVWSVNGAQGETQ